MSRLNACLFAIMIAFVAVSLSGCGNSSRLSGLSPVSGTLYLDDAPLEGGIIMFHPLPGQSEPIRAASCVSQAGGKFTMMTLHPDDGVYPGKYQVTVEKTDTPDLRTPEQKERDNSADLDPRFASIPPSPTPKKVVIVPEKYNIPDTSGLSIEVDQKGNRKFEIRVSSK